MWIYKLNPTDLKGINWTNLYSLWGKLSQEIVWWVVWTLSILEEVIWTFYNKNNVYFKSCVMVAPVYKMNLEFQMLRYH